MGDGGLYQNEVQNLENYFGMVVCINDDGSVFFDNLFVMMVVVQLEIYFYGYCNIQGIVLYLIMGCVWIYEYGLCGGDEINIICFGDNYGWLVVIYGINYNGLVIFEEMEGFGLISFIWQWMLFLVFFGMVFYFGEYFLQWEGDLLVGIFVGFMLLCYEVDENLVLSEECMLIEYGQCLCDVVVVLDGYVYLVVDDLDGCIL